MSDVPQGPGWWRASDGKFYPPQPAQPPPVWVQAQPSAPARPAPSVGKLGGGCLAAIVGLIMLIGLGFGVAVFSGGIKTTTTTTMPRPAIATVDPPNLGGR